MEIAMLHTPYQEDGRITDDQVAYMVKQLEEEVIPKMEKVAGKKLDRARLSKMLEDSSKAEDLWVKVLESAKNVPSPIDSYFAGVYYMGPLFTAFRGSSAPEYYRELHDEIVAARTRSVPHHAGRGNEGGALPAWWWRAAELDQLPGVLEELLRHGRGDACGLPTYTKVGGVCSRSFLHGQEEPHRASAATAWAATPTGPAPARGPAGEIIKEYKADGFLIKLHQGCNSFSDWLADDARDRGSAAASPVGFIERPGGPALLPLPTSRTV
ncbi:MAG: 2-hydroxyacyl-CoA dehydratase [Flavobacteriales bacterium]|nr:2-hydroxyacyl-CoA dehydratase [Flavobacteriales bacterium]